jgi:hypothetical protein
LGIEGSGGSGSIGIGAYLLLQGVDLHPGAQAWTHRTEVKFFHEDEVAVNTQQGLAIDVLVAEDGAVLLLDANIFEVFCDAGRGPCLDLFFGVVVLFLVVGFMAVDVREAVVTAVLAARVVCGHRLQIAGYGAVARSAHVGDVFVNDSECLMHDGAADGLEFGRTIARQATTRRALLLVERYAATSVRLEIEGLGRSGCSGRWGLDVGSRCGGAGSDGRSGVVLERRRAGVWWDICVCGSGRWSRVGLWKQSRLVCFDVAAKEPAVSKVVVTLCQLDAVADAQSQLV